MSDPFALVSPGFESPATHAAAVTPNDSADLGTVSRSLYVGVTGDVKVTTRDGDTEVFVAVPAGSWMPVAAKKVFATGTTASAIIALW